MFIQDILQEREGTSLNYFKVNSNYIEQLSQSILFNLALFRFILVYLGSSCSILVHLALSRFISIYIGPSRSILVYFGLSQSISVYLGLCGQSRAIYGCLWLFWAISGYLRLSQTILTQIIIFI